MGIDRVCMECNRAFKDALPGEGFDYSDKIFIEREHELISHSYCLPDCMHKGLYLGGADHAFLLEIWNDLVKPYLERKTK